MTGPEHYRAAEDLLALISEDHPVPGELLLAAAAQAHATLALAAATLAGTSIGFGGNTGDAWRGIAGCS